MTDLHEYQILILKTLLYNPESKFSELNSKNIDNNHFNYHLKYLMSEEFVEKTDGVYLLTNKGHELANRIDTTETEITKQPKIGIMIRIQDKKGRILLGMRKKNPGKNKLALFTEKVRLGESFEQTLYRCLKNETGLIGQTLHRGIIRVMYYSAHMLIEDTVLICFDALVEEKYFKADTEESQNIWIEDMYKIEHSTLFPNLLEIVKLYESDKSFFETIQIVSE